MTDIDRRADAARFYDLQQFEDDIPFYRSILPSPDAAVLELGCGTGRVTVALADACAVIHGIELSTSMLAIARDKILALESDVRDRVVLHEGDISDFDVGRTFDLIVAPYRVFQALETDAQVEGLMHCVRRHLAAGGACVLTMFHPMYDAETLRREWVREGETPDDETTVGGERIVWSDRRLRMDRENLVLYPELVYRRYRDDELLETVVMPIVMRCWYPDQIVALLEGHEFRITGKWGGYHGGEFGAKGKDLVLRFEDASPSSR